MSSLVVRVLWSYKNWLNVKSLGLPVIYRMLHIERLNTTDSFLQRTEPKLSEVFANLLCDVFEEVHNELWLTVKSLPQLWVLRRNTNWARIQVTDTHHDATAHHKRRRCKTKFFST